MAAEKQFENKVKRFLCSVGVYPAGTPKSKMPVKCQGWFTKIWGGGFQKSGIPDLICCVNGIFIAPELKASDGSASDLQKLNVSVINESGGIGIVLYPDGFDNFKKLILGVIDCNSHIAALNALKNAHSSTKCAIWTK